MYSPKRETSISDIVLQVPCCVVVQLLSHVRLFTTPGTVARQAPLSVGFSRQEHWRGLPFPPPGDLSDPETEPVSPVCLSLAGGLFTTEQPGKPLQVPKPLLMLLLVDNFSLFSC